MRKQVRWGLCISLLLLIIIAGTGTAYAEEITSGALGETIQYTYDRATHTLIISGNGYMDDYDSVEDGRESPFCQNTVIEKVVVEPGVFNIGDELFRGCVNLREVDLSSGLRVIGERAFQDCSDLSNLVFPETMESLGEGAFKGCEHLQSISMSADVHLNCYETFYKCRSLDVITLSGETEQSCLMIRDGALYQRLDRTKPDDEEDHVVLTLMKYPSNRKERSYRIGKDVHYISHRAFEGNTHLKEVHIPKSRMIIYYDAFEGANENLIIQYDGDIRQWHRSILYDGEKTIHFSKRADLKKCIPPNIPDQVWTGNPITVQKKPGVGRKGHIPATVKVSYRNNQNVGRATVTYTGIGDYKGTMKVSFNILPKGSRLLKATRKKNIIHLRWSPQKKQISGYQIEMAADKRFKKNKKYYVIKKPEVTSKICINAHASRYRYVRVRTFKTVSGKRYCSDWSKAKEVHNLK